MSMLSLSPSLLLAGLPYLTVLIALILLLVYLSPKGAAPIVQVLDALHRILYGKRQDRDRPRKRSKSHQFNKK